VVGRGFVSCWLLFVSPMGPIRLILPLVSSNPLKIQPDVECGGGVGEGADGDEIHSG